MIFLYGDKEVAYLKEKDKALGRAIDKIGPIEREVIPDLFEALVSFILGQQISAKAWRTVRERMRSRLPAVTPEAVSGLTVDEIQSFGATFKKAAYVKSAAEKVLHGELDLISLQRKPEEEVCAALSTLDGVGVWTAQMLMLLGMQRPDVISFGDLAIRRGLCMLYEQETIAKEQFEVYRRRYSPYASVASLYLWAIAAGAIHDLRNDQIKGGACESDE